MKNSFQTKVFFNAKDNSHSNLSLKRSFKLSSTFQVDPDVILPFLAGDLITITFEYALFSCIQLDQILGKPITIKYSFSIKNWARPITLEDFAYSFSYFWVCDGLGLTQSNCVKWQNIRIENKSKKERVESAHLDSSKPENAYHFFSMLEDIGGQIDDIRVVREKTSFFRFKNPITKKVGALTELFFVHALFVRHSSKEIFPKTEPYFENSFQSEKDCIKDANFKKDLLFFKNRVNCFLFDDDDFVDIDQFDSLLKKIKNNFTKPFSVKILPIDIDSLKSSKRKQATDLILEFQKEEHQAQHLLPWVFIQRTVRELNYSETSTDEFIEIEFCKRQTPQLD